MDGDGCIAAPMALDAIWEEIQEEVISGGSYKCNDGVVIAEVLHLSSPPKLLHNFHLIRPISYPL